MACCSAFLYSIREKSGYESQFQLCRSQVYQTTIPYHTPQRPACRLIQESWDFAASELTGPLPITYVEDIAMLVQRLGMIWQTSRPEEGEIRAEGNGRIIYSTLVHSIGPIIRYAQGQPWRARRQVRKDCRWDGADGVLAYSNWRSGHDAIRHTSVV